MSLGGCVNVHPSLLPRHRGPSPGRVHHPGGRRDGRGEHNAAGRGDGLRAGDRSGSGANPPGGHNGDSHDRLFRRGAKLLVDSLPRFLQGDLVSQPQDEARATYAPRLTKEDGEIRWELPAESIWRQVRAYHPWPGSYTRWKGRLLKVLEAVPLPGARR